MFSKLNILLETAKELVSRECGVGSWGALCEKGALLGVGSESWARMVILGPGQGARRGEQATKSEGGDGGATA